MDTVLSQVSSLWRDSAAVCALADGERHLGHIVRIGANWHAFDATHFNEEGNGFRSLGTFASILAAKAAVEQARSESFGPVVGHFLGAA